MEDHSIDYLKKFIGEEWLANEFKRINTKSPLKGAGWRFSPYHPWVHYMYELEYILRRAEIEHCEIIHLGKYHYILSYAGMLLEKNIGDIIDEKDAKRRLQNPEQFYDFIWELEVKTMLESCGADAHFVDPQCGNTYDGTAVIEGITIPYECKNKASDDDRYNSNMIFSQVLVNRIAKIPAIQQKVVEFEFSEGRLEDIKAVAEFLYRLSDGKTQADILGRYRFKILSDVPFSTPPYDLVNRLGVNQVIIVKECLKKELYLDHAPSEELKVKVLLKTPERINALRNLNGVLQKANKQLKFGGIVFLQVPYHLFDSSKNKVECELAKNFSNISAVKLVAVNIEDNGCGVKVSRLEELIVSGHTHYALPKSVVRFLSKPMVFSKFASQQNG